MLNRSAKFAFLLLMPMCVLAAPKEKGTTKVQVITARTQIHGSPSGIFSYTGLMFTEINGKKIVYECAQSGDLCPVLNSGETYTASQDGRFIYIPMNSPEGKKDAPVKFKQVGRW